jgi:hypothetical protein
MTAARPQAVSLVGAGAVTPVGGNLRTSAAAARAGLANARSDPGMVDHRGQSMVLARALAAGGVSRGARRLLDLAVPAMHEALAPIGEAVTPGGHLAPRVQRQPEARFAERRRRELRAGA